MKRVRISSNKSNAEAIAEVKTALEKGAVVALPSETVYGLGVLPADKAAVEKLTALKQRPSDKPYTLHFGTVEQALDALAILPPYGYRLAQRFWPGPLTLVYDAVDGATIGVRVPDHFFLSALLNELGSPLFLPSANRSGEKEAISADEVEAFFSGLLDIVVDGGAPYYFKPSTVIDLNYHPFKILREGAVSVRDILDQYIRKRIVFVCTGNTCRSVMAEHLLKKYLFEYDPVLLERYEIISRGVGVPGSVPATPEVQSLLKSEGIDEVTGHRSRQIDRATVLSADLIITMEEKQRQFIERFEPTAQSRLFHLNKFLPAAEAEDIPDPIGGSAGTYKTVFETIETAVKELRDWL